MLATGAGVAIVGCGGSTAGSNGGTSGGTSGGVVGTDFQTLCAKGGQPPYKSFVAGMHPTPTIDGVVYRSETAFSPTPNPGMPGGIVSGGPDDLADRWTANNNETSGALCATASNPTTCKEKVGGYRVLPPDRADCTAKFGAAYNATAACSTSYYLYTRGDEIGVARTSDEIKTLLGTFDTLEETLWATEGAGFTVSCGSVLSNPTTPFGGTNGTINVPDSAYRRTEDGGWDLDLIQQSCGQDTFSVRVHVDYAGNVTVVSKDKLGGTLQCAVAGRRPEGFRAEALANAASTSTVGEYFASMAVLEAASVTAFRRLGRQLAAFGAPRELLARIRKAARDEARHTRATTALARKFGVTPRFPAIGPATDATTLLAIARENAREGCVRETFGALVAHLQAKRAADDDVRTTMATIADEETEHAALSWDIAAWIEARLDDSERAELASERRLAFATLATELATVGDPRVERSSGVPSSNEALRMLGGLAPILLAA